MNGRPASARASGKKRAGIVNERGMVLLGTVLTLLILAVLGMTSLNLAGLEIQAAGATREERTAQHLAEAAVDQVMTWFHDPGAAPEGPVGALLAKRFELPGSGPSFFDAQGRSQFTGTAEKPDVLFDATQPAHDELLNGPTAGWFRSLRGLGRVLKLKVYGPTRPGLLCTIEATAAAASPGSPGLARTVSVQLGTRTIPAVRAAVQAAGLLATATGGASAPVEVHWGDLKVGGDVRWNTIDAVPLKTDLAPVTGQSYSEMARREDRWVEIWVGGSVSFGATSPATGVSLPVNIHPWQEPVPGLRMDQWDYESLKHAALLYGRYYARGRDSLLYPDGIVEPGRGVTADEVFASGGVGDHRGLVFIDTLDRLPPRADNLGTIAVATDYAEGLFVVNAHLSWKPRGTGRPVPALSPPREGLTSLATRVPVQLSGVHLQGVVYTAGNLLFEGRPRVYGAVLAAGSLGEAGGTGNSLEVWYNHDLRGGLVRGLPLVYPAAGTWQLQ